MMELFIKYYKNGACRDGENCRYRHTDSLQESDSEDNTESSLEITPKVPQNVPCRFFKWGTCKFGNRCKFNHVTPVQRQEAKSSDNATPSSSSTLAQGSSSANETRNGEEEEEEEEEEEDEGRSIKAEEWVNAPEFVPSGFILEDYNSPVSYAKAVSNTAASSNPASEPLCPYAEATGFCKKLDCNYLHGDICDLCGRAAMHPYNKELSQKHVNECIKQHEVDMELSFAIQRSRDKTCGVCFEIVMDKSSREQRFGILPNCNHCFCLSCIRKWRQAKQFDNKIIRSCPECRVPSDFVCPSPFWVDTKEEKEKLIVEYKGALSQKDCKYFNKGQGKCPFGNKCFYMHALPDGTKTDVGPPSRQSASSEAELGIIHQLLLWNFLEERDNGWIYVDDHDEVVVLFSDSEDSDWSRLGAQD